MKDNHIQKIVNKVTGSTGIFQIEIIQSLWSGYGNIIRYGLKESKTKTVIVKHIQLSDQTQHPRGWNTDLSHQRKVKSYEVETAWYKNWSQNCDDSCRIPLCLSLESDNNEIWIVLEDLDKSGYHIRKDSASISDMHTCLTWLANFHATFMGQDPIDLWHVGTYWHLETRPDELQALTDIKLKNTAKKIDQKLQDSPYQTIVHGDAKLANFCFTHDGKKVAAVDFQYVGGGCGMKDVAYFISSCLFEHDCERLETELLDFYFSELKAALTSKEIPVSPQAVEQDWRALYPLAWTDFHRFLKGWSPGHWKIHGYSERIAHEVVTQLNSKVIKT
ncbi:MAG: DUF1679 domain-containing protein [gamma proteobacterium symbiont of Taylorina sp.]|nr:DUF1679 domain-containing protein [gamma proteobacterium symbiont of Taylorina sp.]